MTLTSEQCRAARALLNWSQSNLAKASGHGQATVADFERGKRQPHPRNQQAIRAALEKAGIAFIEENGGGAGPRFRDCQT